jgi:hypothetical protein
MNIGGDGMTISRCQPTEASLNWFVFNLYELDNNGNRKIRPTCSIVEPTSCPNCDCIETKVLPGPGNYCFTVYYKLKSTAECLGNTPSTVTITETFSNSSQIYQVPISYDWIPIGTICTPQNFYGHYTITYKNNSGGTICSETFYFDSGTLYPRYAEVDPELLNNPATTLTVNNSIFYCVPNPADNQATVYYSLVDQAFTTLELYNLVGQKIQTVYSGDGKIGLNNIDLNTEMLPNGFYYLLLNSNGIVKTLPFRVVR